MPMTAEDRAACTCLLCRTYAPGQRGDENILSIRNTTRFEMALDLYRDTNEAIRLRAKRDRMIAAGSHPGELVCTCERCGGDFAPWRGRPEHYCPGCCEARSDGGEDGVRTRAHEPGRQQREAGRKRLAEKRQRSE